RALSRTRPWPLAVRLTAWYAGSAFLLVLLATCLLYWALLGSLTSEDDEELADKVRVLRAALDEPGDLSSLRRHLECGGAARQPAQLHVRLLAEGTPLLEPPGMTEALPPDRFPPPLPSSADPASGARDVRSKQGKPFRVLAARAPGGHVVQVGLDRTAEQE